MMMLCIDVFLMTDSLYMMTGPITLSTCMDTNVEFGNLIPVKVCFWSEIFAILRGNLSFRWIFWYFFSEKFQGNFAFFPALLIQ